MAVARVWAVLGQVSTLASGVRMDPHELLDKVADMPVVVPQPDKVVFVLRVRVVQVPQMLIVEVVEISQLQLIEKIVAIPGLGGFVAQKTVEAPQLQFVDEVVDFPVLIPMVQVFPKTIEVPSCITLIRWSMSLFAVHRPGRRHLCRCTEADSHGPGVPEDH